MPPLTPPLRRRRGDRSNISPFPCSSTFIQICFFCLILCFLLIFVTINLFHASHDREELSSGLRSPLMLKKRLRKEFQSKIMKEMEEKNIHPTYPNIILNKQQQQQKKSNRKRHDGKLIEFSVANLDPVSDNGSSSSKFMIWTRPSWAPLAVQRFENLTMSGYFDGCYFFRTIPNFVSQFGINPIMGRKPSFSDDDTAGGVSNKRGTVTFAMSGTPNSRSSQVFINTGRKNMYLDKQKFLPFGKVVPDTGMDVVDRLYSKYGEAPDQGKIWNQGNGYLKREFPHLSYITKVRVLDEEEMNRAFETYRIQ